MAFLVDDFFKGLGKRAAGKEQKRVGEQESAGQFASDKAAFANKEAGRQGALSNASALLAGLYGGKYNFSPDALAIMKAPRQDTSYKHAVIDPSKGAMWNAAGDMVNSAGNLGMQALSGGAIKNMAGQATSLRPHTPGYREEDEG